MKRLFTILIPLVLIVLCLMGCSNNKNVNVETDKISIVSTIFPAYDFARQIAGDNAEVTMLLPPGSESHSYEPSPQDIINIQNSDLFIYVGGESDAWVDKILESMDVSVNTIKMLDCVNIVEEEIVEGMDSDHEDESESDEHDETEQEEHDEEEHNEEEHETEYDEHVWTSTKNAIKITEAISNAICGIDKENSETYKKNAEEYVSKLNQLDKNFSDFFATVENKTLIFGDRFPFRYFADAYGISYYAAFPGCSTETEASAATIAFLINKVRDENISTVFYIEFSSHKIADSIAEATNTKTAQLHSCHNVSKADLAEGASYISLMEQNLEILKEAMK